MPARWKEKIQTKPKSKILSKTKKRKLKTQQTTTNKNNKKWNQLKKQNIHFIAASGRQYQSIVDRFSDIKDEITIIAENVCSCKLC